MYFDINCEYNNLFAVEISQVPAHLEDTQLFRREDRAVLRLVGHHDPVAHPAHPPRRGTLHLRPRREVSQCA